VDTEAFDDNHLIRTRLQVTSENPKRQANVRHFHWRRWPDRGVPMNHLAALRLLFYIGKYKPIVVHCSAGKNFEWTIDSLFLTFTGIGRTGTIVMIYLAQNTLRAGQHLDFYELVAELRRQRAGSVQTLDQYLYIYSVFLR
jgi:protein tyrosine phosphatase